MAKLLLWIVVIAVVLFGLRLMNVAKGARRRGSVTGVPPAQAMVRCTRCGVYLPSAEAKDSPAGPVCGEPACVERH